MTQQLKKMNLEVRFPGSSSDLFDGLHAPPALLPLPCFTSPQPGNSRLQELQHFLIKVLPAAGGSQTTIALVTSAITRTHITRNYNYQGGKKQKNKKKLKLPQDLHLAELILDC